MAPPTAIEEIMSNLNVDHPSANQPPLKEVCGSLDAVSCISPSSGEATGKVKESDVEHQCLSAADQGISYPASGYYGYYYPAFSGEFENGGYYVQYDEVESQYPVIEDNRSFIYAMPGFQPCYSPYGPYLLVTPSGVDGHCVGQQAHPPSTVYQPSFTPEYFPLPLPYGKLGPPSPYLLDPSLLIVDGMDTNIFNGVLETPSCKSNLSTSIHNHPKPKSSMTTDSNKLESNNSFPSSDVSSNRGSRDQIKPVSKDGSNFPSETLAIGCFPVAKFSSHNQGIGILLYPSSPVNLQANARGWGATEKLKTRSKSNGVRNYCFFGEQNRSPRTANARVPQVSGGNPAGSLATDGNRKNTTTSSIISRDQYNLPDFPTQYDHAFSFVIKSYSEDDIHKSIKYNVWASTPNGNKRLDSAYKDAQDKMAENGSKCPVFLFFSVNASGQFCGVAEMTGRVDFSKNMDFWQQDKWNGCFPVKWHIIKDIPNPQFRHIILENNDNKPVTNSRDTQEVRLPQGSEMLNIFKNHVSKTSILDDFNFYESRQKVMLEKRPSMSRFDNNKKSDELSK